MFGNVFQQGLAVTARRKKRGSRFKNLLLTLFEVG
jgi:hypothetical protein